jgi:hypothetical protein
MMRDIYTKLELTIIWFGNASEDSKLVSILLSNWASLEDIRKRADEGGDLPAQKKSFGVQKKQMRLRSTL